MSGVDSPDYDGLTAVEFENYSFDIRHDMVSHRTEVVVFGCDCAATMTDDQAREVHAVLGRYLKDREYSDAQPDLFGGTLS